jgi:2-methylcitrate dehydratase PrpD
VGELRNLAARLVRPDPLPEPVLRAARLCLLDTLGCGLYGGTLAEGRDLVAALAGLGRGDAPVWGTEMTLGRGDCALACGTLSHLRELDDVHYSITHPGAVVAPALLALAWDHPLGQLLAAMALGYETMVRISKASGFLAHRQRGWHATATMGPFGAAAACGHLLGLDEQRMVWALGLAGSRTGGTWAFKADGSMSKRLHPGLAARDGLTAAVLAQAGFTGPEFVLEAEDGGFFRAAGADFDLAELSRDWGSSWAITETEFKWYAACKSVHAPLEACLNLHGRGHRTAIAEVRVGINSSAMAMAGAMYRRDSVASAQLSIPYGVALGLCGRPGAAPDFEAGAIDDEALFQLARKVRVEISPEMEELRLRQHKSAARVEVAYADGSTDREEVQDAKGHLGRPLSEREVTDKFLGLAACALGAAQAESICDLIVSGAASMPAHELFAQLRSGHGK